MCDSLESVAENQPSGAISDTIVDLWHLRKFARNDTGPVKTTRPLAWRLQAR